MENNQTTTEEQKNLVIDFYENFEKLVKSAPDGAQFFALIKAPEGLKDEAKKDSQLTAVQVTGSTLINLFANTFEKVPDLKKTVKTALVISEAQDNPIGAFMSMMSGKNSGFPDIFK